MTQAEVIALLKATEARLRAEGVAALYVYGSYARNEADGDSDLDVFVELADDIEPGLRGYMAPYMTLEKLFPDVAIGYSTRAGIVPDYRHAIETSAMQIF